MQRDAENLTDTSKWTGDRRQLDSKHEVAGPNGCVEGIRVRPGSAGGMSDPSLAHYMATYNQEPINDVLCTVAPASEEGGSKGMVRTSEGNVG